MKNGLVAFCFGIAIGAIFTGLLYVEFVPSPYVLQAQAIEHGAAYYHPETGNFTWRDQGTE